MQPEDYKWKNRLLLVFAPDQHNKDFRKQMQEISENRPAIEERQLLVFGLAPGGAYEDQRHELLDRFKVEEDAYTLILLGKDGLEKYRSQQAVRMKEIFRVIDQMPMRQHEMRKQQ